MMMIHWVQLGQAGPDTRISSSNGAEVSRDVRSAHGRDGNGWCRAQTRTGSSNGAKVGRDLTLAPGRDGEWKGGSALNPEQASAVVKRSAEM